MSETYDKTWTHTACATAGRPLTEEIARDHETLKQCYEQYKQATTDKERLQWTNMYIWQNARHAIAEGECEIARDISPIFADRHVANSLAYRAHCVPSHGQAYGSRGSCHHGEG
jgi:hypothetical protein